MLHEPPFKISAQAFISRESQGYSFVRYAEGGISMLMSHKAATSYANTFGGTVDIHSEAPASYRKKFGPKQNEPTNKKWWQLWK